MSNEPGVPDVQTGDHRVQRGVALIATVRDEISSVHAFLSGIERQTVHPEEFVVVDGGSTDGTVAALERWRPACGCRAHVIVKAGAGIAAGRNTAITASSAPMIAVTDAGAELRTDWLEQMAAPLARSMPPEVVSGFFEPMGDSFAERAIAATITPTLSEIDPDGFMPSSRSVLFSRDAWSRVGGYPEWLDYCEDLVFDFALRDSGARFEFQPAAVVGWVGRPSLRAFAKQYYRYARGDGKAGLFPRRHAARYGAYAFAVGALVLVTKAPVILLVGFGAFAAYLVGPERRVLARRTQFPRLQLLRAVLLAPVIVIVGDVAKMAGYPAGRAWRRRNAGKLPA